MTVLPDRWDTITSCNGYLAKTTEQGTPQTDGLGVGLTPRTELIRNHSPLKYIADPTNRKIKPNPASSRSRRAACDCYFHDWWEGESLPIV